MKTTRGSITAPFFLSASERRYALEHPVAYSIYRIFDLGPNPRFYKLTGDITEILDLTPVTYQARVKAPGAHSTGQGEAGAVLQTLPRVNALGSANFYRTDRLRMHWHHVLGFGPDRNRISSSGPSRSDRFKLGQPT